MQHPVKGKRAWETEELSSEKENEKNRERKITPQTRVYIVRKGTKNI